MIFELIYNIYAVYLDSLIVQLIIWKKLFHRTGTAAKKEEDLPAEYLASPLSKQQQTPPTKSEAEVKEEEELMLALALSKSESEAKEKEVSSRTNQNTIFRLCYTSKIFFCFKN